MALLSREEQAEVISQIGVQLNTGRSIAEILLDIARDYRGKGILAIEDPFVVDKLPNFLKKRVKDYVANEFERLGKRILRGAPASVAFMKTELFDDDVKSTLSTAFESGSAEKMIPELSKILLKEHRFASDINAGLFMPLISLLFIWLFIGVLAFLFIPAFAKAVGADRNPEKLPIVPRLLYLVFNQHKIFFILGIALTIAFIVYVLKDNRWKGFLLPPFKMLEKYKFFAWMMVLDSVGIIVERRIDFLIRSLSEKWKEVLKTVKRKVQKGDIPVKDAFKYLSEKELLTTSEYSFLKTMIETGNFSPAKEMLEIIETKIRRSNEKTKSVLTIISLILVGVIASFLYLSTVLTLILKIKQSMH